MMKAAKLYSFDDIRIEEVPVPEVGPKDALMRTRASGICSGDVMKWYIEKKAPLVLGHEPAGEIVEVGKEVTIFKPGDRVFAHHHAPCFTCRRCRRGDYVQCDTWRKTNILPGGISEYILIPEINLKNDTLTLPDGMSYEDAVLIEPLACVIKGLKRARIRKGDTVLVIGLGFMGVLNGILAKKYGAGRVIGADSVPYRLNKAKALGFDGVIDVSKINLREAVNDMTSGDMAEVVVAAPNSREALADGLSAVSDGGAVLMFSPVRPGEMLTIDPNGLYFRDISLITSYSCGPTDTADALEMIEQGVVRARDVVTHRFPIEKTAEAYRLTAEAGDSLKSLIVF
ncbi:MAG: alcohol dehydrogenase catalytic domain-containing protein [Thermodesulfovibrionales bacterium]|nr:alcohol dehydrogenase catalytic domain-containing protein [Thermodesulfovibrionales bacterium]